MAVPRDAYTTAASLYLPEAYCLDERAMLRDIDAAMQQLQGDTLRTALRHLYIKWGDYSEEGREAFASDMAALADAQRGSPVRRRSRPPVADGESGRQAVLF